MRLSIPTSSSSLVSFFSISKKLSQRFTLTFTTRTVTPSSLAWFTTRRTDFESLNSQYLGISSFQNSVSDRKHFSTASILWAASNKMAGAESVEQGVAAGGEGEDRSKCVFCRIADGKEANEIFYQDDEIVVFQDIKPVSKHHLLVVTREHIRDSKSLLPSQLGLLERLVQTGNKVLLEQLQMQDSNISNLDDVRKLLGFHWPPFHTVSHLHLHVIAPSDQMGFIARTIFRPNSYWFVTPDYVKERLEKMT